MYPPHEAIHRSVFPWNNGEVAMLPTSRESSDRLSGIPHAAKDVIFRIAVVVVTDSSKYIPS